MSNLKQRPLLSRSCLSLENQPESLTEGYVVASRFVSAICYHTIWLFVNWHNKGRCVEKIKNMYPACANLRRQTQGRTAIFAGMSMNDLDMDNRFSIHDIKAVFLDIGGVLLTNGWGRVSRIAAAKHFGYDFDEIDKRHDLIFNIYEEGRVTLNDYLDTILFNEPRSFSKEDYKAFMFQQSKLLPALLDWLIDWKAQHPQLRFFSLNNEPKELHDHRVQHFHLHRLYDGFVASCDVGLRKPDPQIYRVAVGVAGVQPHQCLYIDDREILIRAARKVGLRAWHHQNMEATVAFLQSL